MPGSGKQGYGTAGFNETDILHIKHKVRRRGHFPDKIIEALDTAHPTIQRIWYCYSHNTHVRHQFVQISITTA
jgi:hypothetical protein